MRCNQINLEVLIHGDETSDAFQLASKHIDQCANCRANLESQCEPKFTWWAEAKSSWTEEELPKASELLRTHSVVVEINSISQDQYTSEPTRFEVEPVSLDFLGPPPHPELLGRLGRYDIERVVGQGGMGIVLKGYDTELHRVVAIKVLAPHVAHHASARRRFAREAQAAAAVVHPHVIPIFDVDSTAKLPYLVMQFVPGSSLQHRVETHGPLPLTETLRIAQQTAAGLVAAHAQGLVHRDVKPANILLEDSVDRVLLSDFGLARAVDDASLTRTGIVAGTPFYMSPEQARGDAVDCRSDLFSLGSVMYFMLTGRPPFRASGAMAVLHRICSEPHKPLEQINSAVPYEVARLVDRLLKKPVSDRYSEAHEVERELGDLLAAVQSGRLSVKPKQASLLERIRCLTSSVPQIFSGKHKKRQTLLFASVFAIGLFATLIPFMVNAAQRWYAPKQSTHTSITLSEWNQMIQQWQQYSAVDQKWSENYIQLHQRIQNEQLRNTQIRSEQSSVAIDPFAEQVNEIAREIEALQLNQ